MKLGQKWCEGSQLPKEHCPMRAAVWLMFFGIWNMFRHLGCFRHQWHVFVRIIKRALQDLRLRGLLPKPQQTCQWTLLQLINQCVHGCFFSCLTKAVFFHDPHLNWTGSWSKGDLVVADPSASINSGTPGMLQDLCRSFPKCGHPFSRDGAANIHRFECEVKWTEIPPVHA